MDIDIHMNVDNNAMLSGFNFSGDTNMTCSTPFITFITPYKPILCGIADYSDFILKASPSSNWSVLSFNLASYGVPLSNEQVPFTTLVQYILPNREDFSATSIVKGLSIREDQVLWFQHEFGIWKNSLQFSAMLRELNYIKVVTLHTLHYQSQETPYGLRRVEYLLLDALLPYTDAITVFSDGVHEAVCQAFPGFANKIYVLRHGIHSYSKVSGMSREEARLKIHNYLIGQSDLDQNSKQALIEKRVFLNPDTKLLGGVGFITASKGIELLYYARDVVQQLLPEMNIAAVYIGSIREPDSINDGKCAVALKTGYKGDKCFLLDTYLPPEMLPIALRALDIHFYWPDDCTQSGIIAHSLGVGSVVACRDMEGVGEIARMAGGSVHTNFGQLVSRIRQLFLNPLLRDQISENALRYAEKYSWKKQAMKHFALAEMLCRSRNQRPVTNLIPLNSQRMNEEPSTI